MLVLTRKLQQQINIGENVTITVLRVKGNTVRLGIDAPREIRITRNELPKTDPGGAGIANQTDASAATVSGMSDTQKTGIQQNTARNQDSAAGESAAPAGSEDPKESFRNAERLMATSSEAFASSPLAAHVAALCN